MNSARIQTCAARIASNQRALAWLQEHGAKLTGRNEGATVSIELRWGGACVGAKDAAEVLKSYAKLSIPSLVEQAIRACVNTIEMDRDAIRQEIDRSDAADDATGGGATDPSLSTDLTPTMER